MDEIINQIEKIREINKQHKLVAFVGVGVSMVESLRTGLHTNI